MNNTMLEKGLNYILDAITDEEQSNSLLHLYFGIELIFRAKLYAENWTYIFADMNQADKDDLVNGRYNQVSYSECIDRLVNLCEIKLSETDKRFFLDLHRVKNVYEYDSSAVSVQAIEATMYHALCAIIDFIDSNKVDMKLSKDEKSLILSLKTAQEQLSKKHIEELLVASVKAENVCPSEKRIECPTCGEIFLVPDDAKSGKCHCYYCGYEEKGEMAARAYLSNIKGLNERKIVKDDSIYPLYACPTCKKKALVQIGKNYECFECGRVFEDDPNGRKTVIPNQAEGIKAAKARGVVFGRPKAKLPKNFEEVYQLWAEGQLSNREAAAKLNMAVSTFRNRAEKYMEEIRENRKEDKK